MPPASEESPDAIGGGVNEGSRQIAAEPSALGAVVSKGYVRSNLLVLKGGHGGGNGGGNGGGQSAAAIGGSASAVAIQSVQQSAQMVIDTETALRAFDSRAEQIKLARMKGYEGDNCSECGNFTLVRNGTCMKCNTCGATSGCS